MSGSPDFGQTSVSVSAFLAQISTENATESLDRAGVAHPEERLSCYYRTVPELLAWLENHGRDYPWRHSRDPWKVYATEILLQRTRADAVAEIYPDFFSRYRTPELVLEDDENALYEEVQSLGFGSQRTRSLREAAHLCVDRHGGSVPTDLEELKRPWRVGRYSARATLLFAFSQPLALVDSNIARIYERIFGYKMPAQPHKSEEVYGLAEALTPDNGEVARAISLALIDLGALVCTPNEPSCPDCPFKECCLWAKQQ